MKFHLGVDKDSGLIHSVVTTAANVHDLIPAAELLHGDDEVVYACSTTIWVSGALPMPNRWSASSWGHSGPGKQPAQQQEAIADQASTKRVTSYTSQRARLRS